MQTIVKQILVWIKQLFGLRCNYLIMHVNNGRKMLQYGGILIGKTAGLAGTGGKPYFTQKFSGPWIRPIRLLTTIPVIFTIAKDIIAESNYDRHQKYKTHSVLAIFWEWFTGFPAKPPESSDCCLKPTSFLDGKYKILSRRVVDRLWGTRSYERGFF